MDRLLCSKRFTCFIFSITLLLIIVVNNQSHASLLNYIYTDEHADHPRIILNGDHIARIKSMIKTDASESDYQELIKYVQWRLNTTPPSKIAQTEYHPNIIFPIAFAALFSGSNEIQNYAKECLLALSKTDPDYGDDTDQRYRLLGLAVLYDWLYNYLSNDDRKNSVFAIAKYVEKLSYFLEGYPDSNNKSNDKYSQPKFSGGHSRYGNVVILAAILATVGDNPPIELEPLFNKVKSNWESYNKYQSYVAKDGGYYMGWEYGLGYTSILPYIFWSNTKFNELSDQSWINKLPLWYIYGLRGDGTYPRFGDCNDPNISQDLNILMAYCSYKYENGYAEWFYNNYLNDLWGPYRVWRLIYRDPNVTSIQPDTLSLFKRFDNSGIVIGRDKWDFHATTMIFKSTPFFSINHHHLDQNHFAISYKGSLLIDSGKYDQYGSEHWKNYYTRSIAHNTLCVFDPSEKFYLHGELVTNDGGQNYPSYDDSAIGYEPWNYSELFLDKYRRSGIVDFSSQGESICWIRGDANKAYSPEKLQKFQRDIIQINNFDNKGHPCFAVFDKVVLKKKLKPQILYHFNKKPAVNKNYFRIKNEGGGALEGIACSSDNIISTVVGGTGKEWYVNGKNYKPEGENTYDTGAWRVEFGPKENVNKFKLVTFLIVADMQNVVIDSEVKYLENNGIYGFLYKQYMFLSCSVNGKYTWSFNGVEYANIKKLIVCGLDGVHKYTFQINDKSFNTDKKIEMIDTYGTATKSPSIVNMRGY